MTRKERLQQSRRSFLKAVGSGALALPFYKALESSAIGAEKAGRFVGIYVPHGISAPLYNRQPGDTDTAFNLKFSDSVLAPFDDLKSKVTIIEGIDLAAGVEKNTNGHDASCIMLTGSAPMGQQVPTESVDQFLAVTKGFGQSTPVSSLVLGVGYAGSESGRNISYAKSGAPVSKIVDPAKTYALLFGNVVTGSDPASRLEAERRLRRGQSVLGYIKDDIKRLEARLGPTERVKLQQHMESLSDIEKELLALGGGGSTPAPVASCKSPAKPDAKDFPKVDAYNGAVPHLDKITDLQMSLLAQAIACDRTRFATLFIYYATGPAGTGMPDAEWIHNNVAHTYSATDRAAALRLGEYNRFYFAKCASLLRSLQQLDALDSSLVYITSDMGDPSLHSLRSVPTILAGGLNGKIKMGRRIVAAKGTSNNKILVSILNAFGVTDVTSYGTATKSDLTQGAFAPVMA